MELSDVLIWGGLALIITRYLLPRVLDMLGIGIEKRPRSDQE
ncbi:MAG: hypothetical protein VW554_03620 [Alphaproteobacteria bacterium]|jgi:hypothetical protein